MMQNAESFRSEDFVLKETGSPYFVSVPLEDSMHTEY